jgi:3-oxoacyl-[acyl-carrier protein] reductase
VPQVKEVNGELAWYIDSDQRTAKAGARARLGLPTPEELAALALFLCSPAAAHVTGQVISVNGGLNAA